MRKLWGFISPRPPNPCALLISYVYILAIFYRETKSHHSLFPTAESPLVISLGTNPEKFSGVLSFTENRNLNKTWIKEC